MDRISGKIIKYAGVWQSDVLIMTQPLAVGDDTIHVKSGTQSIRAIEDDIISIKLDGIRMVCRYINSSTLEILNSPIRSKDIAASAELVVYKHIIAESPEDLVTKYELNQLQSIANSSASILIADVSGLSTASYDLTLVSYSGKVSMQILEKIGNSYEMSDVDYGITNQLLTWHSMTPIPDGIAIISFIPSKSIV